MDKIAAPAWTRFFSGLSASAKQQIVNALPAGSVRSLSSIPLGIGQEGKVFPSLTGGKGESAVKVFFNSLGNGKDRLSPIITSSQKFQDSLADKVNLLKSQPSVFPEIHAQHPRGYAMERLTPLKNIEPVSTISPLRTFRGYKQILNSYNKPQTPPALPWWKKLFSSPPANPEMDYYEQARERITKQMSDVYRNRHAPVDHPVTDLMNRLRKIAPDRKARQIIGERGGALIPETDGSLTHINDFWAQTNANIPLIRNGQRVSGMEYHNIMQRANGQAVINDPLIRLKNVKPSNYNLIR